MNQSDQSLAKSDEFNDSFVMQPINFNAERLLLNAHKNNQYSTLTVQNFGDYEQYKLTNLLSAHEDTLQTAFKPKVIEILSVDPESMVIEESEEFQQLLRRYSSYDIAFVGVNGKKGAGKSFFCDKVLNLSQIKGNHFGRKTRSSLNLWSLPFFKNDLCIFLFEISGCQFQSKEYSLLTAISMLLASSIIFVNDNSEKNGLNRFQERLEEVLQEIDFEEEEEKEKGSYKKFLPKSLFNLVRKSTSEMDIAQKEPAGSVFFNDIHNEALPNAMNPSYKGKNQDLFSYSFLIKECINESYIKQTSRIFKHVIDHIDNKSYNNLYTNGNIISKLLSKVVTKLNGRRTIKIKRIYEQIIRDLYISAYNYCVISYQKQLEQYFQDEKPKNLEEMFEVFENATNNALQKFNDFNLSKELFNQYESKLIKHIDEKQKLLLQINEQKTEEILDDNFRNIGGREIFQMLQNSKAELNHGRTAYLGKKLKSLNSGSNNIDLRILTTIHDFGERVTSKRQELQTVKQKNRQKEKQQKQRVEAIKTQTQGLNRQIHKIKEDISILEKRKKSMKMGSGVKQMQQEVLEQTQKLQKKKQILRKLKAEDEDKVINQLVSENKSKISQIKTKQKEIQTALSQLKNPESVSKPPRNNSMQPNSSSPSKK